MTKSSKIVTRRSLTRNPGCNFNNDTTSADGCLSAETWRNEGTSNTIHGTKLRWPGSSVVRGGVGIGWGGSSKPTSPRSFFRRIKSFDPAQSDLAAFNAGSHSRLGLNGSWRVRHAPAACSGRIRALSVGRREASSFIFIERRHRVSAPALAEDARCPISPTSSEASRTIGST